MRSSLVILAMLVAACGPAHHRTDPTIPEPTVTSPAPTELFLVLELDGEFYVQMDSPALEGLVDPKTDVTTVEMGYGDDDWVFFGNLTAGAAGRVHRALGRLGPIEVMDGSRPADGIFFGTPQLVGRVVPHFGEVQEMEEQGFFIDDEDQGARRLQYLAGTDTVVMIPIQGEVYDSVTTWARTRSDRQPTVAAFETGPLGPRDDEAADVAETMPAWKEALARVRAAYAGEDHGEEPEVRTEDLWTAQRLDEDDNPVGPNWVYFFHHFGETQCGAGPDEARLAALWSPKGSLDKPLVLVTGESATVVLEPYVIGDLDGDGALEMIGFTNDLTGEVRILRIKDGTFETLKTAAPNYRDCPC